MASRPLRGGAGGDDNRGMRHAQRSAMFGVIAALVATLIAAPAFAGPGRWSLLVGLAWAFSLGNAVRLVKALHRGDGEAALWAAVGPWLVAPLLAALALVRLGSVAFALNPVYVCGNSTLWVPVFLAAALGGGLGSAPKIVARAHSVPRLGWVIAVTLGLVVCAWATVHRWEAAQRFPTAARWASAQPVVARLPSRVAGDGRGEAEIACGGGVCIVRRCEQADHWCKVDLDGAPPAAAEVRYHRPERRRVAAGEALRVRLARRGPLVLVEAFDESARGRRLVRHHAAARWVLAFNTTSRAQVSLRLSDLRASVAAPPGWIRGGFLGVVTALALTLLGLLRRRLPVDGWQRVEHLGRGLLRFDARDLHVEAASELPIGAVFARVVAGDGAAYRDGPSMNVTHVMRAVNDDPRASAAALEVAPLLLALTALAALAAPLLAASLFGLA